MCLKQTPLSDSWSAHFPVDTASDIRHKREQILKTGRVFLAEEL